MITVCMLGEKAKNNPRFGKSFFKIFGVNKLVTKEDFCYFVFDNFQLKFFSIASSQQFLVL